MPVEYTYRIHQMVKKLFGGEIPTIRLDADLKNQLKGIRYFNGKAIALLPKGADPIVGFIAFDKGTKFVIYQGPGHNIGLIRNRDTMPPGPMPEGVLDLLCGNGWFIHRDGFMVAWGSRRDPACMPSVVQPMDFVHALKSYLSV